MKLDPKALAERYEEAGLPKGDPDVRPGVQAGVDDGMIYQYVIDTHELPDESAKPFSEWLHSVWFEFVDDDTDTTNKQIIDGALASWRGQ
jgi:hypothetical protein